VILLRLKNQSGKAKIEAIANLLKFHFEKIKGNFIVVTEDKIRVRK